MSGGAPPGLPAKPRSYYQLARTDLIGRLPRPLGRVLDVGCAEGAAADLLRAAGARELVGIELDAAAAALAAARYDLVLPGSAEDVVSRLDGAFDTVLCYDVLEHLVDPWRVLRHLRALAAPDARLHVSIPNARHHSLVRDLAVRGTFGYAEWGHRDVTHLRWFTRRDLVALLEDTGWRVQEVTHGALRPVSRRLARLTRGLSAEFLVWQWQALARPAAA
ncbi:MAG: class I SAM-dependent methyltransferase [Actinomycetota bacterium]